MTAAARTLLVCLALAAAASRAVAQEAPEPSDAAKEMLEAMRSHGILSDQEYTDLYRRQAVYEAKAREDSRLPGWIRNWTFGGDTRLRFDRQDYGGISAGHPLTPGDDNVDTLNNVAIGDRNRWRTRLRLGAEKVVDEGLVVGFRFVSSQGTSYAANSASTAVYGENFSKTLDSDPRSSNQSFGDYFSPKSLFFDRVYLKWNPSFAPALSIMGGKFANPFVSKYAPADYVVWDNDIQPEGVAATHRFDFLPQQLWFESAASVFLIDEVASATVETANDVAPQAILPRIDARDPWMTGLQGGLHWKPTETQQLGARISWYRLQDLGTGFAGATSELGNGGETIERNAIFLLPTSGSFQTDGRSRGELQELVWDAYWTFAPSGSFWSVTPFFQWSSLLNADEENVGTSFGLSLSLFDKIKLGGLYARIPRNGTIALFTDSDLFDGYTNANGFQLWAEYQLSKMMRLRATYSRSDIVRDNCIAVAHGKPDLLCDAATISTQLGAFRETSLDRDRWLVDLNTDF